MSLVDGLLLFASVLVLGGLVACGEGLRRAGFSSEVTRRLVHAAVAMFVVAAPWIFSRPAPLYILAGAFVLVNGAARVRNWWPSLHEARPASWGTVALPLALLPALATTWSVSPTRIPYFQGAFLVVGLADPVAGWIGQKHGKVRLTPSATWLGSATFSVACVPLVGLVLLSGGHSVSWIVGAAALTALVAATTEAISGKGWDNLTVVIAILAVLVPLVEEAVTLGQLTEALVTGTAFTGVVWQASVLDRSGAIAGGLFAASLVGLGGWPWIVPGLAFFVLSSALTALPEQSGLNAGTSGRRTLQQVLANGGTAWALLFVFVLAPQEALTLRACSYVGFLGALGAAAADTWATEIGTRYAGRPVNLADWTRVAEGTSGAVSIVGTGAAAIGAFTVAIAAHAVGEVSTLGTIPVGSVVGAGVVGMAVDSVAGATLQGTEGRAQPAPANAKPKSADSRRRAGWNRLDDDGVNVLCTLGGALAAVLFWLV